MGPARLRFRNDADPAYPILLQVLGAFSHVLFHTAPDDGAGGTAGGRWMRLRVQDAENLLVDLRR
jgi:hypothetical protein